MLLKGSVEKIFVSSTAGNHHDAIGFGSMLELANRCGLTEFRPDGQRWLKQKRRIASRRQQGGTLRVTIIPDQVHLT